MLKRYHRFALRLEPLRPVLWGLGFLSVAVFTATLFLGDGSIEGTYALAAIAGLLWSLWLLAVSYTFVEVPREVDPSGGRWMRLRQRFGRVLAWSLALTMSALLILAVSMTIRTIGIVARG